MSQMSSGRLCILPLSSKNFHPNAIFFVPQPKKIEPQMMTQISQMHVNSPLYISQWEPKIAFPNRASFTYMCTFSHAKPTEG